MRYDIAFSVIIACSVVLAGCSKESREEAMQRVGKAGRALNGEVRANDVEHATPNIVLDQQRKEHIRQNTQWTADNRALYPIEYCQAQLEELEKYSAQLKVSSHEVSCKKAEVTRLLRDAEVKMEYLNRFMVQAKSAYREAVANDGWPVKISGFSLSEDKLKERIVDASQQIGSIRTRVSTLQNQFVHLEKKEESVLKEQKRLVALQEKITATLNDLKIKKVTDGERGISDALNSINDAIGSLGVDYDNPTLEDIAVPDKKSAINEEFDKIMAE